MCRDGHLGLTFVGLDLWEQNEVGFIDIVVDKSRKRLPVRSSS